jgi:hypothetical protein
MNIKFLILDCKYTTFLNIKEKKQKKNSLFFHIFFYVLYNHFIINILHKILIFFLLFG